MGGTQHFKYSSYTACSVSFFIYIITAMYTQYVAKDFQVSTLGMKIPADIFYTWSQSSL